MTDNQVHVFQVSGLGTAPFKLVGFYKMPSPALAEHNPHGYNMALAAMPEGVACGSCNHCGTPIVNNFIIESSDGQKSAVGCDCVAKTGDKGLVSSIKLKQRQINREKREAARQAREAAREQSERKANGGKTNSEIRTEKLAALDATVTEFEDTLADRLHDIAKAVYDNRGNGVFLRDMAKYLLEGRLLEISPRAMTIVTEVAAKALSGSARKAGKAYAAKHEEVKARLTTARDEQKALADKIYQQRLAAYRDKG